MVPLYLYNMCIFSSVAILVILTVYVSLCQFVWFSRPIPEYLIIWHHSVRSLSLSGYLYLYHIMWPAVLCVPSVLLPLFISLSGGNLVISWPNLCNLVFRNRRSSIYIDISVFCNISIISHISESKYPVFGTLKSRDFDVKSGIWSWITLNLPYFHVF